METIETTEVRNPSKPMPSAPQGIMIRAGRPPMPQMIRNGGPGMSMIRSQGPLARGPPRGSPLPPPFFNLLRSVAGGLPFPPQGQQPVANKCQSGCPVKKIVQPVPALDQTVMRAYKKMIKNEHPHGPQGPVAIKHHSIGRDG